MSGSAVAAVSFVIVLSLPASVVAQVMSSMVIRDLDSWAAETIERGMARSLVVRTLVRGLESSDVIVHVETSTLLPEGIAGMTRLVTGAGATRYLRVSLDRDLLPNARAATLAHELQHAMEIATSSARDGATMLELYRRIGEPASDGKFFETRAAQQAGARAWRELRAQGVVGIQR